MHSFFPTLTLCDLVCSAKTETSHKKLLNFQCKVVFLFQHCKCFPVNCQVRELCSEMTKVFMQSYHSFKNVHT